MRAVLGSSSHAAASFATFAPAALAMHAADRHDRHGKSPACLLRHPGAIVAALAALVQFARLPTGSQSAPIAMV